MKFVEAGKRNYPHTNRILYYNPANKNGKMRPSDY